MRRRLIIGLIAIAAAGVSAQQPVPVFRAGIDIITFEASVLDGSGKPVSDLSPTDFVVTVGGQPRRVRAARFHGSEGIESTTPVDAPLTAPVTNSSTNGRIVVFVVDRDSIAPGSERAILESAASLLDGLRPGDGAGVLELPGSSTELTRDHARVRAALMRMTGSRPTTMQWLDYNISWNEALAFERRDQMTIKSVIERECISAPKAPGAARNRCIPDLERHAIDMLQTGRARAHTVLSNLSTLAAQLAPLRGAKQIVLLSSGFPFGQDLLPLYKQFADQAAAAQVVFYALHLDQPSTDVTARKPIASASGAAEFASGLGNVASMSGGAFFMASGNAGGIFQRVANEIHNFYELAIATDPADFTAGPLDVEVKVNRPGATVRNRRRVLAPSKTVVAGTDRLSEMLRQPIDVGEVPVALSVYTMRGDEPSTLRTLVGLDAGAAGSIGPGEWGFAVFKEGNVVATGRQKLDQPAGPWAAAMSAKLLPGRYRLRAAIIDGATRSGVVERVLDVGLRGNQQVQFSDLLVGVADATGRLQPSSRVMKGAPLSALVEVISADPVILEKVRTMIEIVPGGSATPVKRFMMAAQSGTLGSILTNSVEMATTDLDPGRYTAIATPMIGEQPLGKVSRVFEIISRP